MRKLLLLSLAIVSQQGWACLNVANEYVCIGDTVYKGSSYTQGATVVAENPYSQQVTVRSNVSGNLVTENIVDLDLTRGCIGYVCVGQKILKGSSYSQGATVVGINHIRQSITVRSVVSGSLNVENPFEVQTTNGCLENVCVGEVVYAGTKYSQGARVEALNYQTRSVVVRSVVSGNLAQESFDSLFITKGCQGHVCVGEVVRKNSTYTQGATVVAINAQSYRAIVRSVVSGSIQEESIYELQSTTPHYPPQPPIPQWPSDPYPTPRPPHTRPEPVPTPPVHRGETCTVSRLDPSGMFITSYVGRGQTKGEACRNATQDCSRDIKGRQTCNVSR